MEQAGTGVRKQCAYLVIHCNDGVHYKHIPLPCVMKWSLTARVPKNLPVTRTANP